MQKYKFLFLVLLVLSLSSCKTTELATSGKPASKKLVNAKQSGFVLKGTNSEIMKSFKSFLQRYEFEEFSEGTLRIITKPRKLDESSPYYEANKKATDIYDQFKIVLNREDYDVIVDIQYLILTKQMNMKTNEIGFREVNRIREAEKDLINKVKRLLYKM